MSLDWKNNQGISKRSKGWQGPHCTLANHHASALLSIQPAPPEFACARHGFTQTACVLTPPQGLLMAPQLSIRNFFSPSSSAVTTASSNPDESEVNEGQVSERSSDGWSNASSDAAEGPTAHSTEEIATKKRKLSHHRKRGVSSSWLREFSWLRSVRGANEKLGMRCYLCAKHSVVPRSGRT